MTATEALERRIDELCAEVERLRQERDEWRRVAESKQDIIDHMRDARAENAKLRKLVRKVLQFERAGCEGCPYASTCDADCLYDPDCPMREDIERDMRELGVEVEQ